MLKSKRCTLIEQNAETLILHGFYMLEIIFYKIYIVRERKCSAHTLDFIHARDARSVAVFSESV